VDTFEQSRYKQGLAANLANNIFIVTQKGQLRVMDYSKILVMINTGDGEGMYQKRGVRVRQLPQTGEANVTTFNNIKSTLAGLYTCSRERCSFAWQFHQLCHAC